VLIILIYVFYFSILLSWLEIKIILRTVVLLIIGINMFDGYLGVAIFDLLWCRFITLVRGRVFFDIDSVEIIQVIGRCHKEVPLLYLLFISFFNSLYKTLLIKFLFFNLIKSHEMFVKIVNWNLDRLVIQRRKRSTSRVNIYRVGMLRSHF
jgi:hypothetical protein